MKITNLSLTILLLVLMLAACGKPDEPTLGLYPAIHSGDINQINRHIRWGTDINQVDADGRRPLHVAAAQGSQVVVKLLLKNGADIGALDREGHSALYIAVMNGRTRVAELLIKQGAPYDANELLDEAVSNNLADRDVVRLLVSQGAQINRIDANGSTPLLRAITRNNRVLVKHLIAEGADVNQKDGDGRSPLVAAEEVGDTDIIRMLRRNGARLAKP